MNTSENTRLDSTILNAPNGQNTIPPMQQQGAPVPPPIPSPDTFATGAMGEAPMSFDTNGYPTAEAAYMQSTMKPTDQKRKNGAVAALAAGIGGAALGAGVVLLTGFAKPKEEQEKPTTDEPAKVDQPDNLADQLTDGEISVAHNVTDDMTFAEAFAAARSEVGPGGAFTWHGQVYSTYTEAEWKAMDAQAQHDFNDHFTFYQDGGGHVQQDQAHTNNVAHNNHQETPAPKQQTTGGETPAHGGGNTGGADYPYTVDINGEQVEVLGMEQVEGQTVATVRINGQTAFMVDADNDGTFDYLAADLNGDGKLDPQQEVMDLNEANMKIDVAQLQHNGSQPNPEPTPSVGGEPQAIVVHNDETGQNIAAMKGDDGKIIYLIDDDGDQTFDYAWVDLNGNGNPEPDEVMSLAEAGKTITVNDLGGFTSEEQLAQLQNDSDVVVAEEVQDEPQEEGDSDDEDDVVIVDPDDETMPALTDDDTDYDIAVEEQHTEITTDEVAMDDTADDYMDM